MLGGGDAAVDMRWPYPADHTISENESGDSGK
jgi:hypothetical protein